MLIAQISDMHIVAEGRRLFDRVDTAAHLARAVAHILALSPRPDLVLATGDLVDSGAEEEYRHLRRLLAPLAMPVYLIPGNHDAREALRGVFADHRYLPAEGWLHYAVEDLPLRLIALDTLVPGKPHGELCEERLDWLAARLGESTRPCAIFMHHPPFDTGIAWIDAMGLRQGAARLQQLVAAHPQVERVMCGHIHRPIQRRWAGTLASIAPSTAHQLALTLDPAGGKGIAHDDPSGMAVHLWQPGSGLVTHFSFVPRPA